MPYRHTAFFLLTALVLTWPLAQNLATHLPLGFEPAATVPLFNLWTLRWNTDRLLHGFVGYWDAPIFYPTPGTFALSEPQPLTGLLFAPLALLSGNPVLAYNLVLLLILTLNGYAAAHLVHLVLRERPDWAAPAPALLAGLLAQALPFVSNELGVLQLTVLFPICFTFAALYAFARRPTLRAALLIGLWSAITFLTCGYYGLFLSLFLLLGGVLLLPRTLLQAGFWPVAGRLGAGALLGALLLLPVLPAQLQLTADYRRSAATIQRLSAHPIDYLRLDRRMWGANTVPWLEESSGVRRLYPGTGLWLLALGGAIVGWRGGWRRWVVFCTLGAALAFLLSLGLNLSIGGWQPYSLLREYYPGFAQLRSPFRFAVISQILLVALAGFAITALWRLRLTHRPLARLLTIGIIAVSLLEVLALPARLHPVATDPHADWVVWLREQPPGAVAMVPFAPGALARDFEPTTDAMLHALEHGHPLVNGYSGYFPPQERQLRAAMRDFPNDQSIELLRQSDARYIVFERDWLIGTRLRRLQARDDLFQPAFEGQQYVIYRVRGAT